MFTSKILIFLILIIVIIGLLIIIQSHYIPIILGGNFLSKHQIIISDNARIVIDGSNMIYKLLNTNHINVLQYEQALKDISAMLQIAFPTNDLHIVLKNPDLEKLYLIHNIKTQKYNPSATYRHTLMKISKQFPHITYHLAQQNPHYSDNSKHYLKGRDDLLTIYLSQHAYILSYDKFRDFSDFDKIKPFYHYSIKNGKIIDKELIKPNIIHKMLIKPNYSNQFIYQFMPIDELYRRNIKNGTIYIDKYGQYGTVYIAKLV